MNAKKMSSQIKTAQTLIDQETTWVAEELLEKLLTLNPTPKQQEKINSMLAEIRGNDLDPEDWLDF
jgi:hypothetical protein